jgi:putative restriction endonuclease
MSNIVSFNTIIGRSERLRIIPSSGKSRLSDAVHRRVRISKPQIAELDVHNYLVQGRTYESQDKSFGEALWHEVQRKMLRCDSSVAENVVDEEPAAYGNPILAHPRLGQSAFRVTVADAYSRRCAITGENTLFVLEAAHIKPYSKSYSNEVSNGVFLRSDFHTLFDQGYISISPDYEVLVSPLIKEQFNNGKLYYARHGEKLLSMPIRQDWAPKKEYLEWHNAEVFVA